jgi:hypothetical protein
MSLTNFSRYNLRYDAEVILFSFISEGPKGMIKKAIQFNKIHGEGDLYNLGFGDVDATNDLINDSARSNNNDVNKVLATVANALLIFSDKYPNAQIIARGNSAARTRLYMMKISGLLSEILIDFELWGSLNDQNWELYRGDQRYTSLLIRRRFLNNLVL